MNKKVIPENIKIALEIEDNENIAAKLIITSKELALQVIENEKLEAQLVIANRELAISNKELTFQNLEKEKLAAELVIANKKLTYQNQEKEKRAEELLIANKELAFQNEEKIKRAEELVIAIKELTYQNQEKEKRAQELVIANKELAFQNQEKEKRAQELVIANNELAFQNIEKEKRASELLIANKEIESFSYISSHDLQEPLRKIQTFSGRIFVEEYDNLSAMGKYYVERTKLSALHMQTLIDDLLAYSRTKTIQRKFVNSDLNKIVKEAIKMLKEEIQDKQANIEVHELCEANVIPFQFKQLLQNLISNALRYSVAEVKPHIVIKSNFIKYNESNIKNVILKCDHYHISVSDNGIGFDPKFKHTIFEIFQRLHHKNEYKGTGIGLTIARKIVENHNGIITANAEINKGAQFDIYIPIVQIH